MQQENQTVKNRQPVTFHLLRQSCLTADYFCGQDGCRRDAHGGEPGAAPPVRPGLWGPFPRRLAGAARRPPVCPSAGHCCASRGHKRTRAPALPASRSASPREGKNPRGCHCRKNDLGSACASGVLLLGGFIRKLLGLDLYFQSSFSSHPPFLSLHSLLQGLQNLWSDPSLTFPELVNQAACPRPQRCSSKLRQTGCLLGGWADDVG